MIIDVHTHPPADRAEWPGFLAALRFCGIDYAVTSFLHHDWPQFPTPTQLREANAHARDFAAFANGAVLWLAYLNPHNDNWPDELETCLSEGAGGVKLWISVKDPDGAHIERSLAVLQAAGAKHLPVLIHSCNRTEPTYPGEADTADVAELARNAPETMIIEGHAGSNWRKGLGLRGGLPNLYVDFSAYLYEKDNVRPIVEDLGIDRVLFGSDFGIRDLGGQLSKVYFSDLDPEEMDQVLAKNAARLFGFPVPPGKEHAERPPLTLAGGKSSSDRLSSVMSSLLRSLSEESDSDQQPADRPPDLRRNLLFDLTTEHFCFCGRWPFFPSSHPAAELERELETWGIETAFTASADSLFCDDLLRANSLFLDSVRSLSHIVPLATLDPVLPNWPAQVRHAGKDFRGGFLSPYLHDYRLDDPHHAAFFAACAEAGLPLWINCAVGDYRWRHRATCPRPVTKEEILAFLETAPDNRYVFQGVGKDAIEAALSREQFAEANPLRANRDPAYRDRAHDDHARRPDARFEISRLTDYPGHLADVVRVHGSDRLVYGSEYPLRDLFATRWVAVRALQFASQSAS